MNHWKLRVEDCDIEYGSPLKSDFSLSPQQALADDLRRLHVVPPSPGDVKDKPTKVLRFATEPTKPVKRSSSTEDSFKLLLTPSSFDARKKMKRSLRSCLTKRNRNAMKRKGVTKRVRFSPFGHSEKKFSEPSCISADEGTESGQGSDSATSCARSGSRRRRVIVKRRKRFKDRRHVRAELKLDDEELPPDTPTSPQRCPSTGLTKKLMPTMLSPPATKTDNISNLIMDLEKKEGASTLTSEVPSTWQFDPRPLDVLFAAAQQNKSQPISSSPILSRWHDDTSVRTKCNLSLKDVI
mmetsp:Transcript_14836/g.27977  ORF Transcript_14836/g.27977 Transcript_14836/m.27977 type:complete len:296 (+) Transcript_14836:49-936(+)